MLSSTALLPAAFAVLAAAGSPKIEDVTSPAADMQLRFSEECCRMFRKYGSGAASRRPYEENEPYPLTRQPPEWPPGVEEDGYVLVEYSVGPDGRPSDIRPIAVSSAQFEEPALRAVGLWLFCPVFRKGEPVKIDGIRSRVQFIFAPEPVAPETP